jgi:hypothetical protein
MMLALMKNHQRLPALLEKCAKRQSVKQEIVMLHLFIGAKMTITNHYI